jgi:replicative DNA helicase
MIPPKPRPTSVDTLISIGEERDALGAALLDARQAWELIRDADLDDFGYRPHRFVFQGMRRLEPPFECSALAGELDRHGLLEATGGLQYLTDLDMGVVPERPMRGRLRRLRELARLRRLVRLGEELIRQPYEPGAISLEIARPIVAELSQWQARR